MYGKSNWQDRTDVRTEAHEVILQVRIANYRDVVQVSSFGMAVCLITVIMLNRIGHNAYRSDIQQVNIACLKYYFKYVRTSNSSSITSSATA